MFPRAVVGGDGVGTAVLVQPEPDPTGVTTSAESYYDSMYGRITSAWKVDGKALSYRATVPANTTATLYLPASAPGTGKEGGRAVYELKSGSYAFTSRR